MGERNLMESSDVAMRRVNVGLLMENTPQHITNESRSEHYLQNIPSACCTIL
eukprot:TRINITY_DN7697_c0_g1_i1.p3 TRINITY_DN7697_c0_g1~~TRINITY_DN7697_c0_g1_i1.p3  ORF type:complete len:52 (-),score=5.97 TRINITY_DN7697_c0_g1_i1:213-368(-)